MQPQPSRIPAKQKLVAGGIAILLILLILGFWLRHPTPEVKAGAVARPSGATITGPSSKLLKVGVYLSHYCATGADGTEWAYGHSCQMVGDLHDPSFDVIPLIEPGTEHEENIP